MASARGVVGLVDMASSPRSGRNDTSRRVRPGRENELVRSLEPGLHDLPGLVLGQVLADLVRGGHLERRQPPLQEAVVKDIWPSELTSTGNWWVSWNNGVTWILNDPSYNPLNNEWAVGTVTTLNTFWLAIEGTVNDSDTTITNQANKTSQTEYDPVEANNHAEASIAIPPAAALELTKTVNNANPTLHDTVIFTMIVQNHGPDTATTVKVSDVLPAGLTYVSSSADFGSYDPTTGIWTIGNLPANTIAHLTITCTVEQTGTINNEAQVTSLTYDPELYPRSALITVNVKAPASTPSQTSVAAGTISMQTTGAPFVPLALGILLVFAGFTTTRRKP